MKADLTRSSFDPLKRFSRVLMQQGRVQLDADWNEQADILLHMLRRLVADAFPNGGGSGFALAPLALTTVPADDLAISPGTFYAGGFLCELDATPVAVTKVDGKAVTVAAWTADGVAFAAGQYVEIIDVATGTSETLATATIAAVDYSTMTVTLDTALKPKKNAQLVARRIVTYKSQPYLPAPPALARGDYQVYIDVWERVVTTLQDDTIREVALNGPDTALRTQVVWQIKTTAAPARAMRIGMTNLSLQDSVGAAAGTTEKINGGTTQFERAAVCLTPQALANLFQPATAGTLRARAQPGVVTDDPCTISPDSAYRGENQLYRVEIHTSGEHGTPSFMWSRENGSVALPVVRIATGSGTTTVTLGSLGRDERFGLAEGDWVELEDDRSVLSGTVAPLLQIASIDRQAMTVTLKGTAALSADASLHPLLRRWDHKAGDPAAGGSTVGADGALPIVNDTWLDLEDGVQVQFPASDGATYRSGDYWLIPARVATGEVVWPQESGPDAHGKTIVNPLAKPPDGVVHAYASLGIVTIADNAAPVVTRCEKVDRP